jgi:hypothetical protein
MQLKMKQSTMHLGCARNLRNLSDGTIKVAARGWCGAKNTAPVQLIKVQPTSLVLLRMNEDPESVAGIVRMVAAWQRQCNAARLFRVEEVVVLLAPSFDTVWF